MGFVIANRDVFWPDLKVPFEIPENSFPRGSEARKTVLEAIRHINEKTEVQLFDRNGRDDIDDYIEYRLSDTLDPQGNGIACHSPVGRQGGTQVVNCDATKVRVVVHETCHALGLRHEHQRPDRDDFVKIDLTKKPNGVSESNYPKRNDLMVGAYDLASIMHYRGAEMTARQAGAELGGDVLTATDVKAINAMKSGGFLSMEDDDSNAATIEVQTIDGTVSVKKGDFRKIVVPSNRFFWYSGDSREWTTASPSTNVVHIYRKRNGREILWFCFNDPKEVHSNLKFLGDEHDKCDSPTLRVFGKNTVTVSKGETVTAAIGDGEFKWRCGDSNEQSVAPDGTNVVFVTRAASGRDITWACYRKR